MTIIGGTDTARVERLREIMSLYYKGREIIFKYPNLGQIQRKGLIDQNSRVTLDRISTVLAEEWTP